MSDSRSIWSSTWKLALAGLIGLTAGLVSWGSTLEEAEQQAEVLGPEYDLLGGLLLLDLFLGLVTAVLVAFRRAALLPITATVAFLAGFSSFSIGAFLLVVTSLSIRRRPRQLLITLGALSCGVLTHELVVWPRAQLSDEEIPSVIILLGLVLVFLLPVLLGWSIGSRRELLASLRREASTARAGREAAQARARTEERNRIAREFHDELGHRLSMIALHAGALEYREDIGPEQARKTAGAIRTSAQQALSEVRSTLQVLRQETGQSGNPKADVTLGPPIPTCEDEPSPNIAERLSTLAQEVTAAGSPVTLDITTDIQQLPASTGRHLYRVIQETVTNALRHSLGAPITVQVIGAAGDRVDVIVSNPLPATSAGPCGLTTSHSGPVAGSGLGLVGATERAKLAGGGLNVETGTEFVVKAWFPWTR